ncbi:hypothetical protein [Seonamhaeicola marinus]|uniref:PorT family protein n=1 Tax=Seonamhaeicola marinus TaxID=1912246 RepID=A0A5D0HSF0_9FLAO|nr:hypothetical protein [Seonamhaeicola marinus]TYA74175.1 hypothetical protein FUA24_12615 [Seonamhaeicola marinus]
MKKIQLFLLVAISISFVTKSFSQRGRYRISNGIAITGGITQFNISTDNFVTEQGSGFSGGFFSTVDIPHQWYNISFGFQFAENNFGISARPTMTDTTNEFLDYKIMMAQAALLMNIKVIDDYFTIDVGPMLQYGGKLELKEESKANYYINNYSNITADAISNISRFNINGAVGASVGIRNFKLRAQYVYGFTNILKKLEDESLDTSGGNDRFKGNQNMLFLGAMISF